MLNRIKSLLQSKTAQSAAAKLDGDAHLKAGRLVLAEVAYARAISLDERNIDAYVGLGHVCNELENFDSAKEVLAKALVIDSVNADAHYILGTIARQEGDGNEALGHFERAIECRPDFEFAHIDLITLLAQEGQLERAKVVLGKAVAACPGSAAIHGMRGKQLQSQRELPAAIASFRKAVSLAPGTKEYCKSLGDALDDNGDTEEAISSYEKAIRLDPEYFDARLALARAMQRAGKTDGAIAQYRSVLARKPDYADGHVYLGVSLQARGNSDEAMACYRRAAEIKPNLLSAHANLGALLAARGENDAAIACLERAKAIDPDFPMAHYLMALQGGESERAPSAYVEMLFDHYASNFDTHLVKGLKYTAPERLADLLRPYAPTGTADKWAVLDLGCGTGLAGVAVAPFARSLVGVDLSSKMLAKARERKLYDRLEQLDLHTMMRAEASSAYDLVLAADVFVYVGKLDELAVEAHRVLRPAGIFAFLVESIDALTGEGATDAAGRDYRLIDTGRFAHSAAYLARVCAGSGFESLGTTPTQIRENKGKPVQGYLILWKKPLTDRVAGSMPPLDGDTRGFA